MPNNQHSDFINYLLKEKISDLLTAIKNIEPTLVFDIEKEREIILENIKQSNLDIKQFEELLLKRNKTKEKVFKNNKSTKNTKNNKKIDNSCRCQARVWGPIYLNGEQKQYGQQCHKKKGDDSKYCFIHQTKLSHGDYFKEPSIMIREHFEQNSKLIKKDTKKTK